MNFADINLLKAHDGAHFYELGVTRSVTNGIPTLEREERWVSGATYRAMLRVGMPFWTLCVLYSSSWSTFDTLSTKKSTLWRVVHIGGLIFRMFR